MSGTNGTEAETEAVPVEPISLEARVEKLESEVAELKSMIGQMIDGMKRAAAKQIMENPQVRAKMEEALMAKLPIPGMGDGSIDLSAL